MQKKRRFGMKNVIAGVLTAALILTSTPSGILAGELLEVETEEGVVSSVEELAETAPAEGATESVQSLFGEDDADEVVFSVSEDVEATEAITESDVADSDDATETVTETAAESITDENIELITEAETDVEVTAEVVDSVEADTTTATVDGVRGWYYTYFRAELAGATVTVAVPSFFGTSVASMQASYVNAEGYRDQVNTENYGKETVDLKAIEITFFNRRGKVVKAGTVSAEVELASNGADSYVMYQQYRSSMKKTASSEYPYFSFNINNGGTYLFAGLASDGVDRAEGVTSQGKTTFDLTAADGTPITVSAPSGAFSGTTYLEAANADTVNTMNKVAGALADNEALSDVVKAFDLSFHNDTGMEIEPARDVTVTIEAALDADGSYRLIHIKDDGTTEVLGKDQVSFSENGVTFTAADFSTYVISEIVTTVDYLTADGKTVKITVAFDERETIPEGAVLEVEEVFDNEEERAARNERLAHVLFEEYGNVLMSDVRYLNISILVNGEEYEPEFPVQVKAEYSEILNTADPQEYVFTEEFTPEDVEEHVNHFVAVHYTDDGAEILGSKESYSDAGLTETVMTTQGFSDYDLAYIYEYETIEQKYDYRASSISETLAAADIPLLKAAAADGETTEPTRGAGDTPVHKKTLDDNHDGTYTIGLSVTGDADTDNNTASNANVIIVFDTSNSMINYYVPMANGARGSNNDDGSNSFVLYRNTNGTEADDGYTGTVYSRTQQYGIWSYSEYTGQRYSKTIRRADAAEKVLYDFAHALYGYQNEDDPSTDEDESKNIQAALITFNQGATTVQSWTSTETDITNRVSSTGEGGSKKLGNSSGTNWQAALQQAQRLIGTDDSENDPTFVVFITDGQPTQWVGHTSGYDTTSAGYEHSRDEARAIQVACAATGTDSHGALFGIYAYGTEADYLDELMYYAYTGTARTADPGTVSTEGYYNAGDSEALAAAINDIFQKIVKTLGVGAATITDGTTSDVHTTSGEIADLLEVNEDSYQYWLTIPATKEGDTYSFEMKDLLSGDTVAYTATVSGGNVTITWTIDGSSKSATYLGYAETAAGGSKITLEWTDKTNFYNFAPPAARFTDPSVSWDLKGLGTLLDGVEYKVTFEVYPSQYTLDLIADLKNNFVTYDSLDANVKKYLLKDGDNYTLLTNTEASLKYTDSRTTAGEQSVVYDNPEPVNTVAAEQVAVAKEWINNLEGKDKNKPTEMTLKVTRDLVNRYNVILNDSNHWTNNVYISFGLMTVDDSGNVTLKTTGHNYSFAELPEQEYYWELQTEVVRPMLVNNEQRLLVMIDEAKGETVPSEVKSITAANGTVAVSGITYYKLTIGGTVMYYKVVDTHTTLHATNFRRSYLEVHKEITGALVPDDATFDFDITVKNSKAAKGSANNPDSDYYVWFSIFDTDTGTILKDESVVTASEGTIIGKEMENDAWTGYFYVPSETAITVKMKKNYSLRFLNLPEDSTYSISETLSQDYECVSVEGTRGYLAPAEDEGEEGTWTTESTGTVDLTVPSITGTIEYANSEYKVVVTNKCIGAFYVYHSSDNSIEKIYASDSRLGTDGKFNIVKETKANNLYGGYYKAYNGSSMDAAAIKAASYTESTGSTKMEYDNDHSGGFWYRDEKGKPYSYANIQNIVNADTQNKVSWTFADAYPDAGDDAFKPTVGTVYYLKEVPDYYLTSYVYSIYNRTTRVIDTLYEMTAIDDCNYLAFTLDSGYVEPGKTEPTALMSGGRFVKGIKFNSFTHDDGKRYGEMKTTSNSYKTQQAESLSTYDIENVFAPETIEEGYLAFWTWSYKDPTYSFCPVWQTPDGIYVHGNYNSTLSFPEGNNVDKISFTRERKS